MEQVNESTQTQTVVATVQYQMQRGESGENQTKSENSLDAERKAMRSAILDFPQYGPQFAQRHPLRILVAEDSMVNMKIALWFLKKLGYHPDVAFTGVEVLDAMKRRCYDLIFMDVEMPEMDGREATVSIRRTLPVNLQPHIVAMTAHSSEEDKKEMLSIGMNDYLTKPLKIEELVQKLIASRPLPTVSSRKLKQISADQPISLVA